MTGGDGGDGATGDRWTIGSKQCLIKINTNAIANKNATNAMSTMCSCQKYKWELFRHKWSASPLPMVASIQPTARCIGANGLDRRRRDSRCAFSECLLELDKIWRIAPIICADLMLRCSDSAAPAASTLRTGWGSFSSEVSTSWGTACHAASWTLK